VNARLEKQEVLVVAGLLAAVLLRTWVLPMSGSLWIDEWCVFQISSKGPLHINELSKQYVADQRLMSLAGWLTMQLAGTNEFGMRLYSLLCGCFALFAIYRLGRRWLGARAALFSVLFFPCFVAVYQQTANARPYMLALAFFLSVMWSVELWLERKHWIWLLTAGIGSYLLASAHMIQITGLGLVALRVMWTIRPWNRWIWPFAVLLPGFAEAFYQTTTKPLATMQHLPPPPPEMFLNALFPQPAAGLFLLALAALLGLRLGTWGQTGGEEPAEAPSMRAYILAAWVLPVLLVYGASVATGVSIFTTRYYFTAFPGAAWVLGSLLARLEPFRWRSMAAAFIALSSTVIVAGLKPIPHPNHENWRDAIATLRQMRSGPAEPVLFYSGFLETDFPNWREYYKPGSMARAGFAFYRFEGNIIGLPYSDLPERIAEVKPELETILASNKRVWLLSRSRNGPMMDWLDAYLSSRGWKARNLGDFESVRLDILEPVALSGKATRPDGLFLRDHRPGHVDNVLP